MGQGLLEAGEGQLPLDRHQEAEDAERKRPSEDEGRPIAHLLGESA
jgi:hypothetical protein